MEQAGIGIVGLVFMRKTFQRRDVTAIAVAADHAVFRKGGLGEFSDRSLLEVGRDLHLEMAGIPMTVQRQGHKNLRFLCSPAPFFASYRTAEVRIVKLDHAFKLVLCIPLSHSRTDALEQIPCALVGHPQLSGELEGGDPTLIHAHQIEREKPLCQRQMGLVQHRPCRHGYLVAALGALIPSIG